MRRLFITALFFQVFCCARINAAENERSFTSGNLVTGQVVQVADLDNITVRVGEREFSVALANVLPLSAWPSNQVVPVQSEFQKTVLEALRSMLLKQEVTLHFYREITKRNQFPLVYVTRQSPQDWQSNSPSGRMGWGVVNYNLRIIELGYSPWVRQSGSLDRYPIHLADEWFLEAAQRAKQDDAGINKFPVLAAALEDAAKDRFDPPPLVVRDLDRDVFLRLAISLVESSDPQQSIAGIRALGIAGRELDKETRGKTAELLVRTYRKTKDRHLQIEILHALRSSNDASAETLDLLQTIANSKSDDELRALAQEILARITNHTIESP